MSRETTRITFEGLPLEVRQAILSAIPDLKTLQAAIQTGHCLYSAFMDARKHITTNVLEHQIDPEFMYDAVMTEMTLRKKDPFTDEGLLAFVEKYKARDQELFHSAFQGTIPQASRLAQFHDVVEFFITDFASSALQHKEAETGAPQNRSLSWRERHRIGRSLYRFEVFCNIFTDNELYSHPNGTKVRKKIIPDDYEYYNYFVPWENEQLACIRDYLFKTITPAFEDVVMNVPTYTGLFSSIDLFDNIQGYLEQGLQYVRRIMESKTTEEWFKLIEKPLHGTEFLNDSLDHTYKAFDVVDPTTGSVNLELEEDFPKPWYADSEGGPRAVWHWAHRWQGCRPLCGSPPQAPLREWGYVMWDLDRLEALIDFSKPWEYRDYMECVFEELYRREDEKEKHRNRARYWVRQKQLDPDYFFGAY